MEFSDVVKNRYSCKKYDAERQVTPEQLTAILEAGRVAPTAKNLQEQHVYVLQSEADLALVDELTPCRYGAPTVLVVAFDTENVYTYPGDERDSGIEDATIVATHMILAAANEGVDSCWVNRVNPAEAKEKLGLPDNEEILMFMDLGFAVSESSENQEAALAFLSWMSARTEEETVLYSELGERLHAALGKVPPPCREAFEMNRFKRMKYQEIADMLGVSKRTVESRIGKTLAILRVELKDFLMILLLFSGIPLW